MTEQQRYIFDFIKDVIKNLHLRDSSLLICRNQLCHVYMAKKYFKDPIFFSRFYSFIGDMDDAIKLYISGNITSNFFLSLIYLSYNDHYLVLENAIKIIKEIRLDMTVDEILLFRMRL